MTSVHGALIVLGKFQDAISETTTLGASPPANGAVLVLGYGIKEARSK